MAADSGVAEEGCVCCSDTECEVSVADCLSAVGEAVGSVESESDACVWCVGSAYVYVYVEFWDVSSGYEVVEAASRCRLDSDYCGAWCGSVVCLSGGPGRQLGADECWSDGWLWWWCLAVFCDGWKVCVTTWCCLVPYGLCLTIIVVMSDESVASVRCLSKGLEY